MKGEPASEKASPGTPTRPGPRVGVTAARKGAELTTAFERRGARVLHGPTLGGDRPVDDDVIAAAIDRLAELRPQWFAASTGMGMRLLGAAAERTGRRDALVRVLRVRPWWHAARRPPAGSGAWA